MTTDKILLLIIIVILLLFSGCIFASPKSESESEKEHVTVKNDIPLTTTTPQIRDLPKSTAIPETPVPTPKSVNNAINITNLKPYYYITLMVSNDSMVVEVPSNEITGNLTLTCDTSNSSVLPLLDMGKAKLFEFTNLSCGKSAKFNFNSQDNSTKIVDFVIPATDRRINVTR